MEDLLFKKVYLWVVGLLTVLACLCAMFFGTIVKNEAEARISADQRAYYSWVGDLAYAIEDVPSTAYEILSDKEPRRADLSARWADRPSGWIFHDTSLSLSGYLLFSRIDNDLERSVVELVDLSDFSVKHHWAPDPEILLADVPRLSTIVPYTQWNNQRFRVMHPLLLGDGSLVFHGQFSPIIALDTCGDVKWMQSTVNFHHSLTVDAEGNFWAPSLIEPTRISTVPKFRDDAITQVSPDGDILFSKSMAEILMAHGRKDLIYQNFHDDPLHMNDIEPVLTDGPYWKKGDIFVSMRRKSLTLLYRPSTDRILWMKQGPWVAQHDIDIIDDTTIAVFNNNLINRGHGGVIDGNSDVRFYDFATDTVTSPYAEAMRADGKTLRVLANTNGLMDFSETGYMIVEEDTAGRLLIYSPERKLVAEYINRASNGIVYRMAWSRYIPQALGDDALAALAQCG